MRILIIGAGVLGSNLAHSIKKCNDVTNLARNKTYEKEATIENAYPNIFVVKYEENERNVTYSYTDVLTRNVEVQVFDGEEYSPLIPPVQEELKINL